MADMTDKKALRKAVRQKMAELPGEAVSASDAAILAAVLALPEYKRAPVLFTYCSIGREVDTQALICRAAQDGKKVALPVVLKDGIMYYALVDQDDTLLAGRYKGIPEPGPEAVKIAPGPEDLFIVPALCFDRDGYRLGQGGGYYDRYLPGVPCLTVGLAREKLLMERVPREAHDRPVACLVTERKTTRLP